MKARYFLGMGIVVFGILVNSYVENHYTMHGVIKDGYIVDCKGEKWDFENHYKDGTKIKITFDTNHTDNTRLDDIIVSLKAE